MDQHITPDRLLKLHEVMALMGLSRPTIYRAVADGRFPKPIKLGRASRWSSNEIHDHIETAKATRVRRTEYDPHKPNSV